MRDKRWVASFALGCLMSLGAASPAFAGLKISLVYIENPPQPGPPLVQGGGHIKEIMEVAAKNWERVFKQGGGNWKITIEYGWARLLDRNQFARGFMLEEGGNPVRITRGCILFNTEPNLEVG